MYKRLLVFIWVCALWLFGYVIYWLSIPKEEIAPIEEIKQVTGFEAQIDYELSIQKKLLISKYDLQIKQKELQELLNSTNQNMDMNESAIRTAQSRLNDKYKQAIYSTGTSVF